MLITTEHINEFDAGYRAIGVDWEPEFREIGLVFWKWAIVIQFGSR